MFSFVDTIGVYFYRLLLALQLEGYHLGRFWRVVHYGDFMSREEVRQTIDRTGKMKLIVALALMVGLLIITWAIVGPPHRFYPRNIVALIVWTVVAWPLYIVMSVILLWPVDMLIRQRILWRARRQLRSHPDLTIIAITGSYGKTSAKHIITHLLGDPQTALMTSGNLNTQLGIARVIRNQLTESHRFFVVEMGAYKPGNIRDLCRFVDPSVGVITGITAQHLERFGSLDAIIQTKYELIDHLAQRPTPGHALICLTSDDAQHAYDTQKTTYTDKAVSLQTIHPSSIDVAILDDFGGISFDYDTTSITAPLLAPHNSIYIIAGLMIGEIMGVSQEEMIARARSLPQIQHRVELIRNTATDVTIIDDSYNANVESFRANARMIAQTQITGRRWLLTPGLVELGDESEAVHKLLGAEIAQSYDGFLFVDTNGTRAMAEGLRSISPATQIIIYETTQGAHAALGDLLHAGDVIVFQNDITDNYG